MRRCCHVSRRRQRSGASCRKRSGSIAATAPLNSRRPRRNNRRCERIIAMHRQRRRRKRARQARCHVSSGRRQLRQRSSRHRGNGRRRRFALQRRVPQQRRQVRRAQLPRRRERVAPVIASAVQREAEGAHRLAPLAPRKQQRSRGQPPGRRAVRRQRPPQVAPERRARRNRRRSVALGRRRCDFAQTREDWRQERLRGASARAATSARGRDAPARGPGACLGAAEPRALQRLTLLRRQLRAAARCPAPTRAAPRVAACAAVALIAVRLRCVAAQHARDSPAAVRAPQPQQAARQQHQQRVGQQRDQHRVLMPRGRRARRQAQRARGQGATLVGILV